MLSEYRQRYSEYLSEKARDEYLYFTRQKRELDKWSILAEYSDLFSKSAIEELRKTLDEVSESRETERSAIRRLIAFAPANHLILKVRDISIEIEKYLSATLIDFDSLKIPLDRIDQQIACVDDISKRRELWSRRTDLTDGMQGMLRERAEIYLDSIEGMGYQCHTEMRRDLLGVDYERVARSSERILTATEDEYLSGISKMLIGEAGVTLDEATIADLLYLERFDCYDGYFDPELIQFRYREVLDGLGLKTCQQNNLEFILPGGEDQGRESGCFPIRIPYEIKLVISPTGGQSGYREMLRLSGQAQHFAWTSRELHPEFRYIQDWGDDSVSIGWGMLFESLIGDGQWLMGTLGFVENKLFCRMMRTLKTLELRRLAAGCIYECEYFSGKSGANTAGSYKELMEDALRVKVDEGDCLRNVTPAFIHSDALRGMAFEAQLREYLKIRFGSRWWTSQKAGEMLVDLWNTGQRYSAEALASLIGLGDLDYDWLVSELLS